MKRPNVTRMRRAMERDRAHQLKRNPEFRVSLRRLTLDDIEAADVAAREWQGRVRRAFPDAQFRIWREPFRDEQVMRWYQSRGVV